MVNPKKAPSPRERLQVIEASMQGVSEQGFLQRVLDNVWDDAVRAEILAVHQKSRERLSRFHQFIRSLVDEHHAIQAEIQTLRQREASLQSSIETKQERLQAVSAEVSELQAVRESIRENERKLVVRNKALEQQVKELTKQRDSALAKVKALSEQDSQMSRQVAENAKLQDDLARARAEVTRLKAKAKAKDKAHSTALADEKKTTTELRSEMEKLRQSRASMQIELNELRQRLDKQGDGFTQVLREMQEPLHTGVNDTEFHEMSIALSRSLQTAQNSTDLAERYRLRAENAESSLVDMKEALADALRINEEASRANQAQAETVALRQQLETVIAHMRQLVQAKQPAQDKAELRKIMEQNQLLTERLQKAIQSGSYWHGIAKATQAECARLAKQVTDLQQQLSQIIASDDAMLRQLMKEETPHD